MDNVKILEVKQSIFASNDEQAAALRAELKAEEDVSAQPDERTGVRQNHDAAPHHCSAAKMSCASV